MNDAHDTIAAISTAPGVGAISIVRVSGPESFAIADQVVRCAGTKPSEREGQTFVRGFVHAQAETGCSKAEEEVDEVILLLYRGPHSYTREDVIEIQGHGGSMAARRVLRAVLDCGARMAEPGEFTMRAFLNGRLDLLQAEAVMDIIGAKSERAAAAAIEQLEGSLSTVIQTCYNKLLSTATELELSLDFDDEDLPEPTFEDIVSRIGDEVDKLESLMQTWGEGHLLRDGALVAISGRPNVGKSTLMNRLIGSERAIVASEPGTTRDTIEESTVIDGVPLRLVDTAGLRDTDCPIETEGVNRAKTVSARADINLYVIDGSVPLESDDRTSVESLEPRKTVLVLNKIDIGEEVTESQFSGFRCVKACLLRGEGTEDVRNAISGTLGFDADIAAHAVISERHRSVLSTVVSDTREARNLLEKRREDLIVPAVALLRAALDKLGELTGQTYTEELLSNIFSRFCIGK